MTLILLEALLVLVLGAGIVWWTMFSGRRQGELVDSKEAANESPPIAPDQAPHAVPHTAPDKPPPP